MPERDQASHDAPGSASDPQHDVSANHEQQQEGVGPHVEPDPMRSQATPVLDAAASAATGTQTGTPTDTAYRCDLCRAAHPEWCARVMLPGSPSLPMRGTPGDADADKPGLSVGPLVTGADGVEWLLCEICCALVEQDQWAALVRRMLAAWEKRHGRDADVEIKDSTEDLIERLRTGCFSDFQRL